MGNIFLSPFYKKLQLEIAQTIFSDNRVHHIGKLNCNNIVDSMDLGLIAECKNFSLPVTILNQCFEVSKDCEEMQAISKIYTDMDVLISFLNLSRMNSEEHLKFIKQMQGHAPKALFIDYENPDRNLSYPMFYTFMLGEKLSFYKQKLFPKKNHIGKTENQVSLENSKKEDIYFKKYIQNGALTGFMHELSLQENPPKIIKQKYLFMGGLGFYYCEW